MITNVPLLFFVDQSPEVVEQFRTWLMDTNVQCIVVEPVNRAFSLIVRDNPWGVVLTVDDDFGRRLCTQIRSDDLLEDVHIIALSRTADNAEITQHMFGDFSADVYGKMPLEEGVVTQWLSTHVPREHTETAEVEIELTSDLLVTKPMVAPPNTGDSDIKVARLELELFEQTEQLSDINRALLRSKLQAQELVEQNTSLTHECERLSALLASGVSDAVVQEENQRLRNRLQVMESHIAELKTVSDSREIDDLSGLSSSELVQQIQLLKRERDDKVNQVNALHGELQLTRQAVESLRGRTTKAEERLTESQDLGVLREQQLQRELMALQRQVANQNRTMELSKHREQQLTQQLELLQTNIQDIQQSHEAERSNWLTDERLTQSNKEEALLLEIQTLTDALQAQLMSDDNTAAEQAVVSILERQLSEKEVLLRDNQAEIVRLTTENQRLQNSVSDTTANSSMVDSAKWARQQKVLDSTLKALEESLARQDELEILLSQSQQRADLTPTSVGIPIETIERIDELEMRSADLALQLQERQAQLEVLQDQLQASLDETLSLKTTQALEMEASINQVKIDVEAIWQVRMDTLRDEFERDKLTGQSLHLGNLEEAEAAEQMIQIQLALDEMTTLKADTEHQLLQVQERVEFLQSEKGNLERSLADSQAMADVLERAAETEVRMKESENQELQARLEEAFVNYRELEKQTAQVIGERDSVWAVKVDLEQREIVLTDTIEQLNQQVATLQGEQTSLSHQLSEMQETNQKLVQEHLDALANQEAVVNDERTMVAARITELEEQIARLELDVTTVQADLNSKTTELEAKQSALDSAMTEMAALSIEIEAQKSRIQELEEMLHVATTTKDILSTEVASKSTQLADISLERDELRASLDDAELSLVELQGQLDSFNVERSSFIAERQSLQHTLMEQSAELEAQLQIIEELQLAAENASVSAENNVAENEQAQQALTAELQRLSEERMALETQLQALQEEHQRQMAEWTERLESERQRQSMDVQDQIVSIQTALDLATTELSDAQGLIQQLESERTVQQQQIDALQAVQQELQQTQVEVQRLTAQLQMAQEEVAHLQNQSVEVPPLDESTDWADEETELIARTNGNVSALEQQLLEMRKHRADLLQQIDLIQAEQNNQQQRIQELTSSGDNIVAQLQEERDDAQAELAMLQIELGIAQSTSRQIAQRAEMIRESALEARTRWAEELKEKEETNQRLRARIEKMERGLSAMFVKYPTV